jgi:hypothetical protein
MNRSQALSRPVSLISFHIEFLTQEGSARLRGATTRILPSEIPGQFAQKSSAGFAQVINFTKASDRSGVCTWVSGLNKSIYVTFSAHGTSAVNLPTFAPNAISVIKVRLKALAANVGALSKVTL